MNKTDKFILEKSQEEAKRLLAELEKTKPTTDDYKKIFEEYSKTIEVISKVQCNADKKKFDFNKFVDNSTKIIGTGLLAAGLYFEFTGGYFHSDILKTGLKAFKFIK